MKNEDKKMLWRISAVLLGAALPCILLLKPGLTYGLLAVGLLVGLTATKGDSLRGSVRLMLDSWVVVLCVLMLGSFLVSSAMAAEAAVSFDKWLDVLLAMGVAAGMFILLRQMPGAYVEVLLKSMAVTAFCMMGLALLDALLDEPRLSLFIHGSDKYTGQYRLNFFSSALAVILPFVWARLLMKAKEGEPFARKVALPGAAVSLLTLVVCGGRAGWAGGMVAVVVFLYMAGRYHKLVVHARHWLSVALVVVAGLGVYALAYGPEFVLKRLMIVPEGGRGMMSGRLEVWQSALAHIDDAPLFGVGLMGFRHLPGAVDMHPHNWVLQMLLETGLVGTALFVALMGVLLASFVRYAKANLYGVAALASLLAFLTAGLANTSIFNMWWVSFFVFTSLLGWRAGWAGDAQHKRKKGRVIARTTLVGSK
ncbi:MAG: O-antigen ligase family protein [Pseudomonadaceae bacterium]|nr:O-antigen ligase family protein [Pseudomonadaceae bacterium]